VDRRAAFVALLPAGRPHNDFIDPRAQVVPTPAIPSSAPQPSAVPKLRRNPRFFEEEDMRMQSLALALAAAVAAAPVAATDEAPTIGVRYGDLDLTSAAGQRQLDIRLERAAREVCGLDEKVVGSHLRSKHSRECYREARRELDQQYAQLVSRKTAGG
jgi:UrcA family protein